MPRKSFQIFLLSPARAGGLRTQMLCSPRAEFDLAKRLRNEGATIGEVFAFLSGLYFRGKLTYSIQFARAPKKLDPVWVITSNRGLIPVNTIVTAQELAAFGDVQIDPSDERYTRALNTTALHLLKQLPIHADVVLLGSIGTKKYVELLLDIFGTRLKFPPDFVGRGDMSRGGLLLRCAEAGRELEYISLSGATRHGKRPPKLEPKRRRS
jgi:hypothetical protein